MQKVISRSSYAANYTAKKLAKQKAWIERMEEVKARTQQKLANQAARQARAANKKALWDNHYRGQIAPQLDTGLNAESYGTIEPLRADLQRVPERLRTRCPFAIGDRVVLVGKQYRDCGKIGKVISVKEESQSITIEGVNLANVFAPEYMRIMSQSEAPSQLYSLAVPFKDCRLVFPLENPETGMLRDVIINEIELRTPFRYMQKAGIDKPLRYIAGVMPRVELPYPEEKDPGFEDTESDTLRIEVEERTWIPTLTEPPMPPKVIDELRHKYSKFRTRFDEEFMVKKEAAAQRALAKKRALKIAARTPLDELNLAKREKLRQMNAGASAGGAWTPLSPEIIEAMAKIGLETSEKSGRALPTKTREQFEKIAAGIEDDIPEVVPEDIIEEDLSTDKSEWVDEGNPAEVPLDKVER